MWRLSGDWNETEEVNVLTLVFFLLLVGGGHQVVFLPAGGAASFPIRSFDTTEIIYGQALSII